MEINYHSLVSEFAVTKKELGETENTIRRLTGRNPDDVANGSTKFRPSSSGSKTYSGRKNVTRLYAGYDRKRSREEEQNEESSDECIEDDDSPSKPSLPSTIVAKNHQAPKRTRKATIQELNSNSKIKARNRRIFGALLGTLERFEKEEKKRKVKDTMRAEIEKKVEDANTKEKEKLLKERELLIINRRQKQVKLRILEKQIERAESHEVYATNQKRMLNFMVTKIAKPPIFFLPSSHVSATKKFLEDSRRKLNELIDKKRDELQSDLNEIEESYKKDSVSISEIKESNDAKEESQDVPETESESLVVEQEDSNPEEDESTNDRPLGGSLIDQEFEPIYD